MFVVFVAGVVEEALPQAGCYNRGFIARELMPEQLFRVEDPQTGQTIAAALRQWLPGRSWSDLKKLLQSRRVMVSGNLCLDEGRRLKHAEVIKILDASAVAPPQAEDIKLQFVDSHLLVCEKPAGMTTLRHPEERHWPSRRKQLQPTLDELLPRILAKRLRKGAQQVSDKSPHARVRAVHRLDRDTSGLMVFARTIPAERELGLQFRAHALDRVYKTVVIGEIEAQTFESHLVEDRGDGRRGSGLEKVGKRAVTHVTPLERLDGYTLCECRLETGRTHQIRIHLSEAGHPVCGDKVYHGPYGTPPVIDRSGAPRLALHAAELAFKHPITGENLQFYMELPADMQQFLQKLRGLPSAESRAKSSRRR